MEILLVQLIALIARWVHIVAAMAWIGSSFYFFAVDSSLKRPAGLPHGIAGETWQVHGGGFYHLQKYIVAPAALPDELTWFKWEAYTTWIAGFVLLLSVYYFQPSIYLVDPAIAPMAGWQASLLGIGSLVLGWIVYDRLCKSPVGRNLKVLGLAGYGILLCTIYGYLHLFSGRGAYIHIGALVGTLMVGNVFFVIIPNQKKVIADLLRHVSPDPALGDEAKQRSLHNNYLTLPVVFLMMSNHYPLVYQSAYSWILIVGVFAAGFVIRHYFNVKHAGGKPQWWLWPAAGAVGLGCAIVVLFAAAQEDSADGAAAPVSFQEIRTIIGERCLTCHSRVPQYAGLTAPPKGITFDTPEDIIKYSPQIYEQAIVTKAMPLNNITRITENERHQLETWIASQGSPHDHP